jgi:hypothetical protein
VGSLGVDEGFLCGQRLEMDGMMLLQMQARGLQPIVLRLRWPVGVGTESSMYRPERDGDAVTTSVELINCKPIPKHVSMTNDLKPTLVHCPQ